MAFEIPYDQIRELQVSLRKEAGLSSDNPEVVVEGEEEELPSIKDAISQLDPSPSYLRCSHCNGKLLRGVNSVICVFCGRQHNKDVPPGPLQFTSTFGCRWFLHYLDLDGSELVVPPVEANESNRGQNTPEVQFPLSDLLNLEIRWPSEPEKFQTSVSEKAPTQMLNLKGVDIDNYFTESKIDFVPSSTERESALNKHGNAGGSSAFQSHVNLGLFENVEPSKTVARSKDESGDSFSGWEADFQTAGSGTQHQEPKFLDPLAGSSSVDLSSHMDAVFGPGKDLSNEKAKENATSASNTDDWFDGDIWSNPNAGIAVQNDQFEFPINDKGPGTVGNTDVSSSVNVDWIQNTPWQTSTSSSKGTDNRAIDEDDSSFDAWNDFTSSSNVQASSANALKDDYHTASSFEQESEISLFGGTDKSNDVDFVNKSQPNFLSATFSDQNGSAGTNLLGPDISVSHRKSSMDGADGPSAEELEDSRSFSNGNRESKTSVVENLMSQMHDLSFMLESNLSVPQKKDTETVVM